MGDTKISKCVGKDGKVYDIEEIYKVVRGLLDDEDLPESRLIEFMRSESFAAICPQWHEAFNSSERLAKEKAIKIKKEKEEKAGECSKSVKKESSAQLKIKEEKTEHVKSIKQESTEKLVKVKKEPEESHDHRKQKARVRSISSDSSSEDEKKQVRIKEELKKKKKKKHKVRSVAVSNSDSSSSEDVKPAIKQHKVEKNTSSKNENAPKESESGPKVHPFWLGKQGSAFQPKGKLFNNEDKTEEIEKKKKRRQHEESSYRKRQHGEVVAKKKVHHIREPAPYSYYRKSTALVVKKVGWKPPQMDKEFSRMQNKHKLKPMSVLCVDLLKLDTHFHHPAKGPPSSTTSIPLKRNMHISEEKGDEIVNAEKVKRDSYKPVLNKMFRSNVEESKRRMSRDDRSSLDGEASRKDKKHHAQRRRVESSSDSSSSDPVAPKKGMNQITRDKRNEKFNARKGTADYKAEQRKRQLEQIKAKNEKYSNKGTRKLPWESNEYFERRKAAQEKKDKEENQTAKEKEKRRLEDKLKFMKKPNAPATSIQKILSQIDAANKEAAKKPPVALKIPKLSDRNNTVIRKPTRIIQPSELRNEVELLLESNVKVEMPIMTNSSAGLSDYTIRKIAWWCLKNEKEPADDVVVHPELHDNEIMEPWFKPEPKNDGFESDSSSIGCVSDPEGINKLQVNEITSTNIDGDIADEYCGLGSLQALIRRPGDKPDAPEIMKAFFKVRPGTNYEKKNFEAKCFLCDDKVFGQRQLGAHIRSEVHKNHFRNYSLKLVTCEEKCLAVEHQKYFKARLVEYTTEKSDTPAPEPEEEKPRKVEVEIQPSDSPRAVIDGEDESQDLVAVNDLPTDQLSLPSLTLFDLQVDQNQLQAKFILKRANKWTEGMETKWTDMLVKEANITEKYNDTREHYINAPNTHPLHDAEWLKFWNRRCDEFEAEGKDPDGHDFTIEWEAFWFKRMQEIMKVEVEKEISKLKSSFQLDFKSLLKLIEMNGLKFEADTTVVKSKEAKSTTSKENSQIKKETNREHSKPQKTEPPKQVQKDYLKPQNADMRMIQNNHSVMQNPVKQEGPSIIDKLLHIANTKGRDNQHRESEFTPKAVKVEEDWETVSNNKPDPKAVKIEEDWETVSNNKPDPKAVKIEEDWETVTNNKPDAAALPNPSIPEKSDGKTKPQETINADYLKSGGVSKISEAKLDNPPTTKRLPVAPPPPKISQSHSKHETERRHTDSYKDSRNKLYSRDEKPFNSRRDNKDERRDRDRDRNRDLRDEKRDLRDIIRDEIREEKRDGKRKLSPDGGRARHNSREYKSDRKRSRRSTSKEIIDDQRKDYRPQSARSSRNSNSGSEREEPKGKKSKDKSTDVNGCRDTKREPESMEKINSPAQITNLAVSEDTEVKDINTLLQELEAAKQLVEFVEKVPIVDTPYLPDSLGLDDVEKISDVEPMDFISPDSPVNTSVIMEQDDNFGASPITSNVEIGPNERTVAASNTNIQSTNCGNEEGNSTPEEGEIGSGGSSISMGVDVNQVSTFIHNTIPGLSNLSEPRKKSKSAVETDPLDASDVSSGPIVDKSLVPLASKAPFIPLPGPLDRNSIGYHLFRKEPGEIEDSEGVTPPSSPKPSRKRSHRDRSKSRGRNSKENSRRNSKECPPASNKGSDDFNKESYGEDPFENYDLPHRRSKKERRRRRRERASSSELKSQGLSSAPGPQCSKPSWARGDNKYQPLPPPPPPPRLQSEWQEKSWNAGGNSSRPYRNDRNRPPYRNQNSVPQPVTQTCADEEEEEDWEKEEHIVTTVPVPPHLSLRNNTEKTEKEDEAPYSPAWDEDSNDRLVDKPSEKVFSESPASPTPPTPTYSGHKPLLPSPGIRNTLPLTGSNAVPLAPFAGVAGQYYNSNIGAIGAPAAPNYAHNMHQNVPNQDWNNSYNNGYPYNNPGLNYPMNTPNQQMNTNHVPQQQRYPPPNPYQQNYGNWNTW